MKAWSIIKKVLSATSSVPGWAIVTIWLLTSFRHYACPNLWLLLVGIALVDLLRAAGAEYLDK